LFYKLTYGGSNFSSLIYSTIEKEFFGESVSIIDKSSSDT